MQPTVKWVARSSVLLARGLKGHFCFLILSSIRLSLIQTCCAANAGLNLHRSADSSSSVLFHFLRCNPLAASVWPYKPAHHDRGDSPRRPAFLFSRSASFPSPSPLLFLSITPDFSHAEGRARSFVGGRLPRIQAQRHTVLTFRDGGDGQREGRGALACVATRQPGITVLLSRKHIIPPASHLCPCVEGALWHWLFVEEPFVPVAHFLLACCDSVVYYYSESPRVWGFCAHVPVSWGAEVTTLPSICSLYQIPKK